MVRNSVKIEICFISYYPFQFHQNQNVHKMDHTVEEIKKNANSNR